VRVLGPRLLLGSNHAVVDGDFVPELNQFFGFFYGNRY
jgi:hypothetical protein